MAQLNHGSMMTVHILRDEFGPAPYRSDCDAIACTVETRSTCERINVQRVASGLEPLEVIVASHIEDAHGGIVSSTRIRAGLIDRDGNPWLVHEGRDRTMPKVLDSELKKPMGVLYTGPEDSPEIAMTRLLDELDEEVDIVAVGDVCVETLLDLGVRPWIAVVDDFTKRRPLEDSRKVDRTVWDNVMECSNPPGMLTDDLINICRQAVESDGSTMILVEGEEDLAPIPLHMLIPLDSMVVYGQPGEGVVARLSDEAVKHRCRDILATFGVVGDD